MKKICSVLAIFLVLILTGCMKNLTDYEEISYDEYQKLIEKKESFPLVIGADSCSACAAFRETMTGFITKYQVNVKYIDIDKLSEEEYEKLKVDASFDSTPTTVFIQNGKYNSFYNRMVGSEDITKVIQKFRENKYIK